MIARKSTDSNAPLVIRRAALIATTAMGVQMVVGLWLVMQIPSNQQSALMGGDLIGSGMLLVSILLGLVGLNQLATIAIDGQGEITERQVWLAGVTVTAVVTIMVGVAVRVSGLVG